MVQRLEMIQQSRHLIVDFPSSVVGSLRVDCGSRPCHARSFLCIHIIKHEKGSNRKLWKANSLFPGKKGLILYYEH